LSWDGGFWQTTNFQGTGGTGTVNNYTTNVPYAPDHGTVNAVAATFTPVITALPTGLLVLVKILNANTGPTTFDAGTGVKPLTRLGGIALQPGDLPVGAMMLTSYDGTQWQVIGLSPGVAAGVISYQYIAFFQSVNTLTVYMPHDVKTMIPLATIAGGSPYVSLSGGACKFLTSGRYQISWEVAIDGLYGTEPFFGLASGLLFWNGNWVSNGVGWAAWPFNGNNLKEVYAGGTYVNDFAVNDTIWIAGKQDNGYTNGYYTSNWVNMTVARVY
jgi:hypothetical protein